MRRASDVCRIGACFFLLFNGACKMTSCFAKNFEQSPILLGVNQKAFLKECLV